MNKLALQFAPRLLACAAIAWLAWRFIGAVGLVVTAPLFGIALAKPLIDLGSELWHRLREHQERNVEGQHYAYHGTPLQVIEDESHRRWVRVSDVRRVVGPTASDGALALSYPNGCRKLGDPPQAHLSDDALIAHLGKHSDPAAIRFRNWAEREIAFPAQRLRKRFGIRLEAPDFRADE